MINTILYKFCVYKLKALKYTIYTLKSMPNLKVNYFCKYFIKNISFNDIRMQIYIPTIIFVYFIIKLLI